MAHRLVSFSLTSAPTRHFISVGSLWLGLCHVLIFIVNSLKANGHHFFYCRRPRCHKLLPQFACKGRTESVTQSPMREYMHPLQKHDFFMRLLFSHLSVNCWGVKWNRWSSKALNTSDDGVTWKLQPERQADGELALDSLVRDRSASHLIVPTVSETGLGPLIPQHRLQPVWTITSVKRQLKAAQSQLKWRKSEAPMMHFGRVEPCGGIVCFLIFIHMDFSVFCWFWIICFRGNATFWPRQAVRVKSFLLRIILNMTFSSHQLFYCFPRPPPLPPPPLPLKSSW